MIFRECTKECLHVSYMCCWNSVVYVKKTYRFVNLINEINNQNNLQIVFRDSTENRVFFYVQIHFPSSHKLSVFVLLKNDLIYCFQNNAINYFTRNIANELLNSFTFNIFLQFVKNCLPIWVYLIRILNKKTSSNNSK